MAKKARRRRIHIEITLVSINEDQISYERFVNIVNNMANIYEVTPEVDEEDPHTFHVRAWDAGGPFKILGTMSGFFHQFAAKYPDLIQEIVDHKGAAHDSYDWQKNNEIAFCARIKSPSLNTDLPVLRVLNLVFAKIGVGVYFESFPGGMVVYAEDGKAFTVIETVLDPAYVQFKAQNQALMESDPIAFLRKMKENFGF